MVQGRAKATGAGGGPLNGKRRPKGKAITQRKAVPHTHAPRDRTTAAINRRNEQLMAGRLAHEGGTLSIVPRPERVERYEKGGAALPDQRSRQLFHTSMARHARMKREGLQVGAVGEGRKEAAGAGVGKKRKRGMKGIRKVGDDWFDEADAALEQLRYHSEDEDDGFAPDQPAVPKEPREGDAKRADETAVPVAVPATSQSVPPSPAAAPSPKVPHGSAAATPPASEDVDEVAQARKRAKALLGGWFTSRSEKEGRQRQASAR